MAQLTIDATELRVNGDRSGRMPTETGVVAAIDVGTTKICTIVGRKVGTKDIQVLGHSTVPCNGLRKGNVSDIAATAKALRESVQEVEQSSGYRIESAFIGVTGSHVSFENRKDRMESNGGSGLITADDINRNPQSLATSHNESGREIIHAIRMNYSLDGENGIRNPIGMHSHDVQVETHVVSGRTSFIKKLEEAVESAALKINGLVLEPLASGLAVLTPAEKETGAFIVDIGGGTTDVVGFWRGRVRYSGVIPVGGFQFTNDIALTYNTPYEAAETAKLRYASTEFQALSSDNEVSLPVIGRDAELRVPRADICQLARERAQELASLVKIKLDEAQIEDPPAMRVVLTGGTSNLPGLPALMQRNLQIPVRHGVPNVRGSIPDKLKDPAYATSVGILLWALTEHVPVTSEAHAGNNIGAKGGSRGLLPDLLRRVSKLMPLAFFATRKGRI